MSRAEPGKALDLIVRAMLALPQNRSRLTVIGAGRELDSLRELAHGNDRVVFTGALSHRETLDRYPEADAFLFPSRYDVFGLALVEAMGAGLAVVTSDAPGVVPDLVVDRSTALVVRQSSVEAWTRAISEIVRDSKLRRNLGNAAAEAIQRRWTLEDAVEGMLASFRLGILASSW